jgi:hypothetical protein
MTWSNVDRCPYQRHSREVGLVPLDVHIVYPEGEKSPGSPHSPDPVPVCCYCFGASLSSFNSLWMNLKIAVLLVALVIIFAAGILHELGPDHPAGITAFAAF